MFATYKYTTRTGPVQKKRERHALSRDTPETSLGGAECRCVRTEQGNSDSCSLPFFVTWPAARSSKRNAVYNIVCTGSFLQVLFAFRRFVLFHGTAREAHLLSRERRIEVYLQGTGTRGQEEKKREGSISQSRGEIPGMKSIWSRMSFCRSIPGAVSVRIRPPGPS